MSSDYNNVSQFFSHPLVLLFIGAGISGVLIPYFTNRAAKYQKGLEIKTDLVRRINESVTRIVISLDYFQAQLKFSLGKVTDKIPTGKSGNSGLNSRKKDLQNELEEIKKELGQDELAEGRKKILDQKQEQVSEQLNTVVKSIQRLRNFTVEIDNEMKQWRVSSAVIGSLIRSYFPELAEKTGALTWNAFEKTVHMAYISTGEAYTSVFDSGPSDSGSTEIKNVLKEKDEIILQIQNSSVSGLSEDLFHRFIRKFTS